jgi:hypothetical protein
MGNQYFSAVLVKYPAATPVYASCCYTSALHHAATAVNCLPALHVCWCEQAGVRCVVMLMRRCCPLTRQKPVVLFATVLWQCRVVRGFHVLNCCCHCYPQTKHGASTLRFDNKADCSGGAGYGAWFKCRTCVSTVQCSTHDASAVHMMRVQYTCHRIWEQCSALFCEPSKWGTGAGCFTGTANRSCFPVQSTILKHYP